jgi:hypothetical protein
MMSCCGPIVVCVGGQAFNAFITYGPRGDYVSGTYIDTNLVKQNLAAGGFTYGACPVPNNPSNSIPDLFRVVQPLVAGNNIIAHGLPGIATQVEVRNATTGAVITARVVSEIAGSTTIAVAVAVASARITIDV